MELFYSYSHKDEALRDQLQEHLAMLKRDEVIEGWHDRMISGGREWDGQIDEHLDSSDIILLLISSSFISSDYCYDIEVTRAMERHELKQARVIPVILRACDWHTAPFGKLQALPKDAHPVTLWPDRDVAFLDIAKGIRRVVEELSVERSTQDPGKAQPIKPPPPPIPDIRVDFVPRKDKGDNDIVELLQVELAPHRRRLVALWGGGGVGKTVIAAEVARRCVDPYDGRVVWVSADGLNAFSLSTLLDSITSQLGYSELRKLTLELKKQQVRDLVMTAPTLVVLDNFETIEPAERARCVEWLGAPAPCAALITTRDVIPAARNIPIETMRHEEAHHLLRQLILQAHDARAFAKLERDRLIQTAEANPLVLQWIVGQIDLAQDPEEVLEDLRHGEGTAAQRVFNRSFELEQLSNGGRAVLLALSLFAPSAARKAVAEISGLGKENQKKKFREAVRSLSALWLIHTTDESQRLAVEGLTRELTKARLDTDPRAKTFRPRFVSRFLRFAESHHRPTREDYDALESEKDNLLGAVDLAATQEDWRSVRRFANSLALPSSGMLSVRGYWDETLRINELSLKIAHSSGSESQIAVWSFNVALIFDSRGEHREARRLYDQSMEIDKKLNNQAGYGISLQALGSLAQDRGELAEARRLFDESLQINKKLGNQHGLAVNLHELGRLAYNKGELKEARVLLNESLEIETKLGNQRGIAISLETLGSLAYDLGELGEAQRLFDESFEIDKRLGNQSGIASSLHVLGQLAQDRGELTEARRLFDQSFEISKNLGEQRGIVSSLHALGSLAYGLGELAEARRLFDESLQITKNLGDQRNISITKHQLGLLHFVAEEYEAAEELLQESLAILKRLGDKQHWAECLESIGKLRVAENKFPEAEELFVEALDIASTLGIQFRIATVKRSLGLLAEKQNDKPKAIRLLHEALAVFEKLNSPKAKETSHDLERLEGG